uniref:Protein kinase domain-containing protein n=1 Tax=Peronospora matthiolae TaxID=2874970 RepID=A0AAV1V9C8_9STRA
MTEKQQFVAREQPPRPVSSRRLCSAVTFFPLYATERLLSCLGYSSPSIRMQSGRTIAVGSEVAQGGFSFVYEARDARTGTTFALKRIPCHSPEHAQLAQAEIRAHEAFAHPNLMPLEDYAVVSTGAPTVEYYLLFPFMENGTLRGLIDTAISQGVRIPEAQILDLFLQICRAVAELHSKSPPLAHRDIKPENIMLSDEGEPVLTDFGSVTTADVVISKRFDALVLQELAAQQSSMAYRAPELYDVPDDAHVSSATDVWSLGCLLYAMAFGYSPFECSFYDSGVVRVVECTYLAVIGPIKFPKNCSYSSKFCDMIRWILTQDACARPSVFQVIEQLHDGV